MKVIRSFSLILLAFLIATVLGISTQQYAKKEGKACTFCHTPGKFKELTAGGKYYKDHNHSLEGYKPSEQSGKN